jgi:universal stress protein A
MKAKPTNRPGEVLLELNRRDEPLMAAAGSVKSSFRIKRILVPVDFSECSRKALQYAVPLAKEHKAAITLLYAIAPPAYVGGEFGTVPYQFEVETRANSEKKLAELIADEVRGEVSADTLVRSGPPANEIIQAAKELSSDLIVISTHGYTGLTHVFLGSVAEHVVRLAPCPVLVVREKEHEFIAQSSQCSASNDGVT